MRGEPKVRHYASPEAAFAALVAIEKEGGKARVVYAQDRLAGIKLFATQAWYVRDADKRLSAFLLKGDAQAFAQKHGGDVLDFATARGATRLSAR